MCYLFEAELLHTASAKMNNSSGDSALRCSAHCSVVEPQLFEIGQSLSTPFSALAQPAATCCCPKQ